MDSFSRRAGNGRQNHAIWVMRLDWLILIVAGGWLSAGPIRAADPVRLTNSPPTASAPAVTNTPPARPGTVPRIHDTNVLASFLIKPGFRIELVAGESMVSAPVAMAFDENGR